MPTARELLEQADALMRRNRGDTGIPVLTDSVPDATPAPVRGGPSTRERTGTTMRAQASDGRAVRDQGPREDRSRAPEGARAAASAQEGAQRAAAPGGPTARAPDALAQPPLVGGDVEPPLLTDAVDAAAASPQEDAQLSVPPGGPIARAPDALAYAPPVARGAEPPLLTDAVDAAADAIGSLPLSSVGSDQLPWLGADTIDPALHSITGPAPDTVAVVPPVTLRVPDPILESSPLGFGEDRDPTVTRTLRAAGSAATPPPAGSTPLQVPDAPAAPAAVVSVLAADEDEKWRALAEQISMQVLQRLDLFVDTGLKAQLAAHLQPIVMRASAELVETIDDHVGKLVRTYVAEAIEREIAQWRQQNK